MIKIGLTHRANLAWYTEKRMLTVNTFCFNDHEHDYAAWYLNFSAMVNQASIFINLGVVCMRRFHVKLCMQIFNLFSCNSSRKGFSNSNKIHIVIQY